VNRLYLQRGDTADSHGSVSVVENAALVEGDGVAATSSKVLADRLVERIIAGQGLPVVIVNPSTTIGPRDIRQIPMRPHLIEDDCGPIPLANTAESVARITGKEPL
jgi:hypothetical protein